MKKHLSKVFQKTWFFWLVWSFFFFLLGSLQAIYKPKVKTWVLVNLEEFSRKRLPVKILAKDVRLNFLPLELEFEDVKVIPKSPLNESLAPIVSDSISLSAGLWSLIGGSARLGQIHLKKPKITFIQKEKRVPQSSKEFTLDFEKILEIPIEKVSLEKALIRTRIDQENVIAQIEDFDFSLEFSDPQLFIELDSPRIFIKKRDEKPRLNLSAVARLALSKSAIRVSSLHLKKGDSFLIGSGNISGDIERFKIRHSDFRSRGYLNLSALNDWSKEIFVNTKLPRLRGNVNFDAFAENVDIDRPSINFKIKGSRLKIDKIYLGQLEANGYLQQKKLSIEKALLSSLAGNLSLSNTTLELEKNFKLRGKLGGRNLKLRKFLNNIDVGDIPVELTLGASLPCEGTVKNPLFIRCEGTLNGKDLKVTSDEDRFSIVDIERMRARGFVTIDAKKVYYKSDLALSSRKSLEKSPEKAFQRTKGKTSGTISYDEGFRIDFSSPSVNFKDVKNLAELKFNGKTALSGYTQGDSNSAILKSRISTSGLWFEDYFFGNLKSQLNVVKGQLSLPNISGLFGDTTYNGEINIDLLEENIKGKVSVPFLNAEDLQFSLSRELPLPISIFGTGKAKIKLWGPLDITRLNWDLNSDIFKGRIEDEPFDRFSGDLTTRNGTVRTKKVELVRASSKIFLKGKMNPDETLDTQLVGENILLDDFNFIQNLGVNLKGEVNFQSSLKDKITNPTLDFKGELSQLTFNSYQLPSSNFSGLISPQFIRLDGDFFSSSLVGSLQFPLNDENIFFANWRANDFDVVPLISLFNPRVESLNYTGLISSKSDLRSPKGKPFQPTGDIVFDKLVFKRANQGFDSKEPLKMSFRNGKLSTKDFVVNGEKVYFKFESNNSTLKNVDININSKFDLSLALAFAPFASDIGGPVSGSLKIGGSVFKPKFLGSLFIEKGKLRPNELPHSLENIKADILISQSSLLLNSFSSEFAGGIVEADGNIRFIALKNFPTILSIRAKNLNLNYPKDVSVRGSAELKLTGSWFPFLLSGQSEFIETEVTQELVEDKSKKSKVVSSRFLPELILKKEIDPLNLDIDIAFTKFLRIQNSLIESDFLGQINVQGTPTTPRVKGELNAKKGGFIYFRETRFDITESNIKLDGGVELDPFIYLTADTRIAEHDITFLMQGKASQQELRLTSQPELSEQEIINLLILGVTTTELNQSAALSEDQSGQTGVLGVSYLSKTFIGREFKEKLGVNFDVTQSLDQAGENVNKIKVGKRLGDKVEVSISQSVNKEGREFRFDYRFNKNLSTIFSYEDIQSSDPGSLSENLINGNRLGLDIEYKKPFD